MRTKHTLLLMAGLSASARAQETTGDIRGRVTSPSGVVTRAQITASGSELLGERRAATAADGVFRLLALPPGKYAIRVTSLGYRPIVIDSVRVRLGQTTGLPDVALEPSAVALSEVRIVALQTTVDPTRTTIGATLESADYAMLPAERDYKALIAILPHVNTSHHGDGLNVAGSTGLENAYFIDGANVTSPLNGATGTSLPSNFVRSVEVRTGGYEAQFGKALGAIVNAVTHTGTNELESNVFAFFTHSDLAARPRIQRAIRETSSHGYDVGARLSGPIVRDRLWFSAAYNPRIDRADREVRALGIFEERRTAHVFAGKLTWLPRPASNVEVAVFGDPTRHDQISVPDFISGATPLNPDPYLQREERGGVTASARLTSTLSPSVLLELGVSRSTARDNTVARTEIGRIGPLLWDQVAGTLEGGISWISTNRQERNAATARATLSGGRHTAMVGAEYEHSSDRNFFDNPGIGFIERLDDTTYQSVDQLISDSVRSRVPTVYVQDSWRATDRLTLNAGVRWSGQWLSGSSGRTTQRFPDEWQPRLGFNWQLGPTGTQRLFGSYGRFFQQEPLSLASAYYVRYRASIKRYVGDPRYAGFKLTDSTGFVEDETFYPNVDGIEVENFDEYTLGYERVLANNARLTVRGIRRNLRSSFQQVVDSSGKFHLGTPGKGDLTFMPPPERTHSAGEVTLDGAWRELEYRASYVLSRTVGNFTGLYSSDVYLANPGVNAGFGSPDQIENSHGPLPNDRAHVFKLVSTYRPVEVLSVGAFFSASSGTPLNKFGAGTVWGQRFLSPRGSVGRTSPIWDLNLRLTYDTKRIRGTAGRFVLDLLHVGNPRGVVRRDQTLYFATDEAGNQINQNPSYLKATAYQPPMAARFGFELTF